VRGDAADWARVLNHVGSPVALLLPPSLSLISWPAWVTLAWR
jgi:hypothetical protein